MAEMQADPKLRKIKVAILTSSTAESDAALQQTKDYCLFFSKTSDLEQFGRIMSDIHAFAQDHAARAN